MNHEHIDEDRGGEAPKRACKGEETTYAEPRDKEFDPYNVYD